MDFATFQADFTAIFEKNGLKRFCKPQIVEQFYQFTELFLAENAKTNLSAIRSPREMIAKHYADCLLAESLVPEGATILDVGCGGGFPCIPFAIARPDLRITGIDSTQKKIAFVEKAAKELRLTNLKTIYGRIEEKEQGKLRGFFNLVTARAVANLQVLAELTLPFVRVGGTFLALKGAKGTEELAAARQAIAKLGGEVQADMETALFCPQEAEGQGKTTEASGWEPESRHLIQITKKSATPVEYPRAYAAILKHPL